MHIIGECRVSGWRGLIYRLIGYPRRWATWLILCPGCDQCRAAAWGQSCDSLILGATDATR